MQRECSEVSVTIFRIYDRRLRKMVRLRCIEIQCVTLKWGDDFNTAENANKELYYDANKKEGLASLK